MKWFRNLSGIEKTGRIDLLTAADKESEEAIAKRIRTEFPQHLLLAEEGSGGDAPQDGEFIWVVDPIDGTTNFAHGLPIFAVSIALCRGSEPIAGGVYAPALGECYLAAKGAGATRNGLPINVSSAQTMNDALMSTGFPYSFGDQAEWLTQTYGRFLGQSRGVLRLGSAAIDIAYVAAGNLDGFYEPDLRPWDTAAAVLLVREAGGKVTPFEGTEYTPWNRTVVCSNRSIHDEILAGVADFPGVPNVSGK